MVTNSIFNFDPPIFIFPKQGADYNWVEGLAIFCKLEQHLRGKPRKMIFCSHSNAIINETSIQSLLFFPMI